MSHNEATEGEQVTTPHRLGGVRPFVDGLGARRSWNDLRAAAHRSVEKHHPLVDAGIRADTVDAGIASFLESFERNYFQVAGGLHYMRSLRHVVSRARRAIEPEMNHRSHQTDPSDAPEPATPEWEGPEHEASDRDLGRQVATWL